MSILNDVQIQRLCELPKTRLVTPPDPNRTALGPGGVQTTTLVHYDPTPVEEEIPEAERAAFRPMISPFSAEMIRHACALDAFKEGDPYWMQRYPEGVRDHQYIPERKIISRGLTSYGYDVSLADEFKIFTNIHSTEIDPKKLDERCLVDAQLRTAEDGSRYITLPPNGYALGRTNEYFRMPNNVLALCVGKSTYARAGAIVNVTPIEPGFEGHVVIEISNPTSLPMRIYVDEGISQFVFFEGEPCRTSYADRGGKYMGQTGITLPKV